MFEDFFRFDLVSMNLHFSEGYFKVILNEFNFPRVVDFILICQTAMNLFWEFLNFSLEAFQFFKMNFIENKSQNDRILIFFIFLILTYPHRICLLGLQASFTPFYLQYIGIDLALKPYESMSFCTRRNLSSIYMWRKWINFYILFRFELWSMMLDYLQNLPLVITPFSSS